MNYTKSFHHPDSLILPDLAVIDLQVNNQGYQKDKVFTVFVFLCSTCLKYNYHNYIIICSFNVSIFHWTVSFMWSDIFFLFTTVCPLASRAV